MLVDGICDLQGVAGAGTAALLGGDPIQGAIQGISIGALNHWEIQSNGQLGWEGPEVTIWGHKTILGHTQAWWNRASGAITQVNVEFDVILGARLIYNAANMAVSESSASNVTEESTNLVNHNLKYDPRVRMRALEDPVSYNFPYRFDDAILETTPIPKSNGYNIFQLEGNMNNKSGFFEIGVTRDGIIDHRFFKPF